MNKWNLMNSMLNYTQVKELYDDEFNLSPRYHTCGISAVNHELKEPCLMLWNTEREKEIELAPSSTW